MFPASETNNTAGVLSKIIFRDRAFAFRRAKLHARQEAAKILIAFAGFGEMLPRRNAMKAATPAENRVETTS